MSGGSDMLTFEADICEGAAETLGAMGIGYRRATASLEMQLRVLTARPMISENSRRRSVKDRVD